MKMAAYEISLPESYIKASKKHIKITWAMIGEGR